MKRFWHPFEKKAMYGISMLVMITAQVLLLWFIYAFAVQPNPATSVELEPVEKTATAGGELVVHVEVDSAVRHTVHAHRTLECENGQIYVLTPDDMRIGVGKFDVYKSIRIPATIPIGTRCALHLEAVSRVNLLRKDTEFYTSTEFEIVK